MNENENLAEMAKEYNERIKDNPEQLTKSIKSAFWPKKPYSAEAEVKKLRKQLQEKKDLIRELKKDKKDLCHRFWEKNELIEKLKKALERDGRNIVDVVSGDD